MADKKQSPAQEVQEELEEIANGVYMKKADIEKQLAHNAAHPRPIENGCRPQEETDPEIINADLIAKIDEITIMQDKGYNPDRIAAVYKSAADDARRISSITGNEKYTQLAEQLEQGAVISPLMEQTAEPDPHHYIFTATGKEFVLPEQLEEYKKDNPIGAAAFEEEQAAAAQEVQHITIDIPPVDPKLDPNSPDFDLEAWKAAFDDNGGIAAARERMEQAMQNLVETITTESKPLFDPELVDAMQNRVTDNIGQMITNIANSITTFINSDTYKAIKEAVQHLGEWYAENEETISAAAIAAEEMRPLIPFLQEELEAAKQDPQYKDITIPELLAMGIDADGNPTESKWQQLIERAKKRKADFEAAEEFIEEVPRIISKLPQNIEYPLDKINSNVWNMLETTPNGQIGFATEKSGSKKEATVLYSINFDELESELSITKRLTPFDKRCYIAVSALYNCGNGVITAAQIYSAMGNTGRPNAKDLEKINASLTKMGAARVYLDNTQEVSINKSYARFKYDAALLPFERCSAYINNQLCETAVRLFREPPLTTFAKGRAQITTISKQLLNSPISKTDANLRIDDYLIERIAHIKRGKVSNKMLYTTIFDRCGITEKKQKQRAPEKIKRYLDHYKKCGFIKDYTESADGITIKY